MATRYALSNDRTIHLKDNTVLEFFELMGEHVTIILKECGNEVARYNGKDSIPAEYNLRHINQIELLADKTYSLAIWPDMNGCNGVIECCADMSVPRDSACAFCCVYCSNKNNCEYACAGLGEWDNDEGKIATYCEFARRKTE